jgi:hypothetical protein
MVSQVRGINNVSEAWRGTMDPPDDPRLFIYRLVFGNVPTNICFTICPPTTIGDIQDLPTVVVDLNRAARSRYG